MRIFRTVISLIVLVCFVFSLSGCSSKSAPLDDLSVDKVIKILEKDFGAKEFGESNKTNPYGGNSSYFKDGFYMSSKGDSDSKIEFGSFAGAPRGQVSPPHFSGTLAKIYSFYKSSGTGYVMYRVSDKSESADQSAIMLYVEFKTAEDAMACFDKVTQYFFSETLISEYERRINRFLERDKYFLDNGAEQLYNTQLRQWVRENLTDRKSVKLEDLDKSVYSRTDGKAYFNYNLRYEITKWGDLLERKSQERDFDIEKYIDEYYGKLIFQNVVTQASHLRVEGNKLLLIDGGDLTRNTGDVEDVKKLCKAFSTDNPFNAKMNPDLSFQMLYGLKIWNASQSHVILN